MAKKRSARGVSLDAPATFARVDASNLLGRVERFGEDLAQGLEASRRQAPSFRKAGRYVSNVIVAGMGGSAISGQIVGDAFRDVLPVPFESVMEYKLPAHARHETLLIISSYSGETEETLSMMEDGLSRGCRVVGITSGGTVMKRLSDEGHPVFELPRGIQPRAAMPFLLAPVVETLERCELASTRSAADEAIEVCRAVARRCGRSRATSRNPAKKIAAGLLGGVPCVYGYGVLRAAAFRWRTQLNENAKVLAREDIFPGSNHNDINAWGGDPRAKDFRVVLLRDPLGHGRVNRHLELTRRLAFAGNAGAVLEVKAEGNTALARALSCVLIGDFASVYLALRRGVDPTPVDVIVKLKRELARPSKA